MPNKEAAVLIIVEPLGQSTGYLERVLGKEMSLGTCKRDVSGAQ